MDEKSGGLSDSGLSRRRFLGAISAAAAAGILLQRGNVAEGQTQGYQYQDYEFYNYSPTPPTGSLSPNHVETGNQYFDPSTGATTAEGQLYLTNFNSSSPAHGINIQDELYQLYPNPYVSSGNVAYQQVQAAIQVAFQNYIAYLTCNSLLTDASGAPSCNSTPTCANYSTT